MTSTVAEINIARAKFTSASCEGRLRGAGLGSASVRRSATADSAVTAQSWRMENGGGHMSGRQATI
jgi:hypothetical protein